MANTLTAIIPSIFAGLDSVARELIGIIPAVSRNTSMERAAVGQVVTVPVVPRATGGNITPGSVPPDDGDVVIGAIPLTITKSKYSAVRWNGEEQLAIGPTGEYNKILADQFAYAMSWLVNQIEVDLMTAGKNNASRAAGTAGTTPFATAGDLGDFAALNRILDDNGAPMSDRWLIVGGAARQNLEGKQSVLFKANEAGTDELLRERVLRKVMGFGLGFSHATQSHVKGTGAAYTTTAAGFAVGTVVIPLITGAGTILAGDVVTFAGDSNKYVVGTGIAAPGSITLNSPGLLVAIPAAATAVTVGANYVGNIGFQASAMVLASRAPAMPIGGDSADDIMFVTDPLSGISFEIALYREYRRIRYEVGLAWGVGVVKDEFIATLMG